MNPSQEKSIISNIVLLKKRTVNISVLLMKLVQHNVLADDEKEAILSIQDDEQRVELLYELLLRKTPDCFELLLKCLRESGNTSLASLVEESWKQQPATKFVRGKLKRGSSADRYMKEDIGNTPIQDYELGIAEILEEDDTLRKNWKLIFQLVNLSNTKLSQCELFPSFAFKTTTVLRSWAQETKLKPTLGNLCTVLDKNGFTESCERIRGMFEVYSQESESGFLFQYQSQANCPITGHERRICKGLEDNPDFGLRQEKLFLLLSLPLTYLSQFLNKHSKFSEIGPEMLECWSEMQEKITGHGATFFDLSTLLMKNGHKTTAGKICFLSTTISL